jgi:quercetin dioxygenase-like cupin family protein
MRRRSLLLALALLASATLPAVADDAKKPSYPAVPLISTAKNIVGETLHYPKGQAHVTAAIVTLGPGDKTIVHKHGVPLFGYILSGELTVHYRDHGARTYKTGEAFMEAMDVAHYGVNSGKEPVKILAVYMGADGAKNVIPVK